jgi:hypothetical protein
MTAPRVPISFVPRTTPLSPEALLARGEARVRALAARLLACDDAWLLRFRGVATASSLVVLGESRDLVWVPGALYLARDPRAPRLYLPTTSTFDAPIDLVERALLRRAGEGAAPLAVAPGLIIGLAHASPIARSRLRALLGEAHAAKTPLPEDARDAGEAEVAP